MDTTQVSVHEAESRLSELGEMVWKGEKVVVAEYGVKTIDARL